MVTSTLLTVGIMAGCKPGDAGLPSGSSASSGSSSAPASAPVRGAPQPKSSTLAPSTPQSKPSTSNPKDAPAGDRDPAQHPFSSESPWNTAVGSNAKFATASWDVPTINKYGVIVTSGGDSAPHVYVAKTTDPLRKVYRDYDFGPKVEFLIRVPEGTTPGLGTDAHLWIIDEKHEFVTEIWQAKIRPDGDIEGPFPNRIDLRGTGVFDTYHGACAYGGSCLAGLIRKGEIKSGIHHALRMSVMPQAVNYHCPGNKAFVWPANSSDNGSEKTYTGTGNLCLGSLVAIPSDVDVAKVFGPVGSPKYVLAKAMQDYGLYIIDTGYFNIYADQDSEAELKPLDYAQDFAPYLKVVTNNGPNSIGGGGNPRQPAAPALSVK